MHGTMNVKKKNKDTIIERCYKLLTPLNAQSGWFALEPCWNCTCVHAVLDYKSISVTYRIRRISHAFRLHVYNLHWRRLKHNWSRTIHDSVGRMDKIDYDILTHARYATYPVRTPK